MHINNQLKHVGNSIIWQSSVAYSQLAKQQWGTFHPLLWHSVSIFNAATLVGGPV